MEPAPLTLEPLDSVRRLQAAGVKWVWAPAVDRSIDGLIFRNESWWEVPDPLPRILMTSQVIHSMTPRETLEESTNTQVVVVDTPISLKPDSPPGEFEVVENSPGHLACRVEAKAAQLFVVLDRFHAGWSVHIDGNSAEILRVNGDFMGCRVPPGNHHLEFEFTPVSLHWGRRISVTAVFLILTIGGFHALLYTRKLDDSTQESSIRD